MRRLYSTAAFSGCPTTSPPILLLQADQSISVMAPNISFAAQMRDRGRALSTLVGGSLNVTIVPVQVPQVGASGWS